MFIFCKCGRFLGFKWPFSRLMNRFIDESCGECISKSVRDSQKISEALKNKKAST